MIKQKDLQTAIATMESLEGTYLTFAGSTQDKQAQGMYKAMAKDAANHLQKLHEKLNQMQYQTKVKQWEPKGPRLQNALKAFFFGGLVCVLGEGITDFWESVMSISHKKAGDPTVATLIFLAALLTGLGWFDKLQRAAGARLSVPVTGIANAQTPSAREFKREGLIFGIGGRMFQLAGSVIVYGVVTAFVVGVIASVAQMMR